MDNKTRLRQNVAHPLSGRFSLPLCTLHDKKIEKKNLLIEKESRQQKILVYEKIKNQSLVLP